MGETLEYLYQNFYEMIQVNATKNGNKKVILIENEKITNAQLLLDVDKFASQLLAAGVKNNDAVALILPNCYEFIVGIFAVWKLGGVVVPVNNMLKKQEYEYILNDCEAKVLLTSIEFAPEVKELLESTALQTMIWIDDMPENDKNFMLFDSHFTQTNALHVNKKLDELAVIFYTSGTTGNSKGAMLSYKNIFSNMIGGGQLFEIRAKDRFIVYLPMFHAFTFSIMVMLPILRGSSLLIIRKLHPFSNILKQTLLKRVTIFLGVPDVYNALIRARLPWYFLWFNSIRIFISGASALSEATLHRYTKTFKRAKMLEGYGLSECSPGVAVNSPRHQKPYSVGKALPGYEIKIVDDEMVEVVANEIGEIIVRGDCVMMGYLNHKEITKQTIINGWLKTGDLGKKDEDGFIYIVDRIKDLIISKGLNIYPRQIEEALMHMPYVKLAAVIAKKDDHNGEVPVAFIELDDGVDKTQITQAKVKKDLQEKIANFKIPKIVYFEEDLPKTATGKVLKRVLRERFQEKREI